MAVGQDFISNKKVLVAGVTGLFGRGLSYLLAKNNEVHGLCRFSEPRLREEVSEWCENLWPVDGANPKCLQNVPRDFDYVFNEAVQWGLDDTYTWPTFKRLMEINSFFPGQLMEHFAGSGAGLIFGSTGGVYQHSEDKDDLNKEGITTLEGGFHPYDDTKLGGEMMVRYFSREHDIPAVILRYYWPAAPYGEGGRAGRTCRAWLEGKPTHVSHKNPWYHTVGYISDLLYATCAAANRCSAPVNIYNVTGDQIVNYRDVDLAVAEAMDIDPIFEEVEQERDIPMYVADIEKMTAELWKPRVGLKEYALRVVRAIQNDIRTPQDWMFEF
ncbi:MAG: NAD(P)-dependent oxidoreductase [Planctomycetes bacterium]|nr:NAD(P)-dependent oxidoreductase [Planctomycetota bacterium]